MSRPTGPKCVGDSQETSTLYVIRVQSGSTSLKPTFSLLSFPSRNDHTFFFFFLLRKSIVG